MMEFACLTRRFQVGYLGLAQVLGNRDMLPPPPEALGL